MLTQGRGGLIEDLVRPPFSAGHAVEGGESSEVIPLRPPCHRRLRLSFDSLIAMTGQNLIKTPSTHMKTQLRFYRSSIAVFVLTSLHATSIHAQHPLNSWARRAVPGLATNLSGVAFGND